MLMEYLDFVLRIGKGRELEYPIVVVEAPEGGEPSATVQVPLDDLKLSQQLGLLESTRGIVHDTSTAGDWAQPLESQGPGDLNEPALAETIGRKLFDVLFPAEIRSSYRNSLALARSQGKGIRIRLRIEAPELAALPWEFLYDQAEGDHVCLNRETPLIRYPELSRAPETLTVQPPIRILGMVASPRDLRQLDTEGEQSRVANAVEHLLTRGDVELVWLEDATWRHLQTAMTQGPWHIFHFIGHGAFDRDNRTGLLALTDEDGAAHFVSAKQIGRLFAGHPSLRLAVLNACEGARISDSDLYSSVGAVLIQRGIPAVVSMQYEFSDRAALEFSRLFYDALARGEPVDAALNEARVAVSFVLSGSAEWATPVLYMRAPSGHLFSLDVAGLIFPKGEFQPVPADDAKTAPTGPKIHRAAGGDTARGQQILLRKVKQYWIEGVLVKSLFRTTFIDLGMEAVQSAVESPWTKMIELPGAESLPLKPQDTIASVFDDQGGSLLILGEPGSGKTTTLLELARLLVARAEHDASYPIPVIFNLSSWAASDDALVAWLANEMSAKYQIPRQIGQSWLEEGWILPMLDGLDEVDADRRAACVESVNRYALETGLTGTVVCCRFKEYVDLPNRLSLNAAVRLLPLQDEQVESYLLVAGDPLDGLRLTLKQEPTLRFDARSPLMLNMMAQAYWGLSANDIKGEDKDTAADRRRKLMDAYVARMFRQSRERWVA